MPTTKADQRTAILSELRRRNLTVTPQALNALVSTVTKASPEIAGDSDSLLLGLLDSGSYTVDLLGDAGANVGNMLSGVAISAAEYESKVQRDDFDPVAALFGPQANAAALFRRAEFATRPIEASDILQQAVSPAAEYFPGFEWIKAAHVQRTPDPSRLRIYSDLESLIEETLERILDAIWRDPPSALAGRTHPLDEDEIESMLETGWIDEDEFPSVLRAVNEFIRSRTVSSDDQLLITYAASMTQRATLGAGHFRDSGGDYNALAMALRQARRFAPERDQPILALTEQDGKILMRPFTYRGIAAIEDGSSNPLLSVSSQALPLIRHSILEEFESLVNRPKIREQEIQNFLEYCPEILRSLGYSRCTPQVMLSEKGKTDMIPDFILHKPGGNGFDILDLKLPTARIAVENPYHRISHEISKAVAQLRAYRNYFKNPVNRDRFIQAHGIEYFEPKLIVAIGRASHYESAQVRSEIEEQVPGMRILTYDELIDYAKVRTI